MNKSKTKKFIKFKIKFLISIFILIFSKENIAHAKLAYIPVGKAKLKKIVLAMPQFQTKDPIALELGKTLLKTLQGDLEFMEIFKFLEINDVNVSTSNLATWQKLSADFLIQNSISIDSKKRMATFEGHFFDIPKAKEIIIKRYISPIEKSKNMAHAFGNDIVEFLTGQPGIFLTKIAMTCEKKGQKEIYVVNYNGEEPKQITHYRSIAFSPAWSKPDSSKLAFSLYTRHARNIQNIDLFEFNFLTSKIRPISRRKGINSGAAYSPPDGKNIALTLSESGTPEIYSVNAVNPKIRTNITRSKSLNVDPNWSYPDGKDLIFVSDRSGLPMIWSTKSDGTAPAKRLTYAGKLNATPKSIPPDGRKIVFAGWLDGRFDIFLMNASGSNIERLTKDEGNNEDPDPSPDGNFITYSSNRSGQKNIYIMNMNGNSKRRLTYGLGSCVSPKWSSPPQGLTTQNEEN